MIDWTALGLFLLCALLFSWVLYEKTKVNDLKNDKLDLQLENSSLIERNQKLDQYLDEARSEATKANHKLMKLEYTEKVFLVFHKDNYMIFGCFRTKHEADNFISTSLSYFIKECIIAD